MQLLAVILITTTLGAIYFIYMNLVPRVVEIKAERKAPTPHILEHHCEKHIGPPRVERVRRRRRRSREEEGGVAVAALTVVVMIADDDGNDNDNVVVVGPVVIEGGGGGG